MATPRHVRKRIVVSVRLSEPAVQALNDMVAEMELTKSAIVELLLRGIDRSYLDGSHRPGRGAQSQGEGDGIQQRESPAVQLP